jgi:hypothetical protein
MFPIGPIKGQKPFALQPQPSPLEHPALCLLALFVDLFFAHPARCFDFALRFLSAATAHYRTFILNLA